MRLSDGSRGLNTGHPGLGSTFLSQPSPDKRVIEKHGSALCLGEVAFERFGTEAGN